MREIINYVEECAGVPEWSNSFSLEENLGKERQNGLENSFSWEENLGKEMQKFNQPKELMA